MGGPDAPGDSLDRHDLIDGQELVCRWCGHLSLVVPGLGLAQATGAGDWGSRRRPEYCPGSPPAPGGTLEYTRKRSSVAPSEVPSKVKVRPGVADPTVRQRLATRAILSDDDVDEDRDDSAIPFLLSVKPIKKGGDIEQ